MLSAGWLRHWKTSDCHIDVLITEQLFAEWLSYLLMVVVCRYMEIFRRSKELSHYWIVEFLLCYCISISWLDFCISFMLLSFQFHYWICAFLLCSCISISLLNIYYYSFSLFIEFESLFHFVFPSHHCTCSPFMIPFDYYNKSIFDGYVFQFNPPKIISATESQLIHNK